MVSAQEAVKVGEEVDYQCNCFGQAWIKAKVEAVNGRTVKVRYGNLDNQVATVAIDSGLIRLRPKPEDPNVVNLRKAFADVSGPYRRSVEQFAHYFDPRFEPAGTPVRPNEWQKAMADLAELDKLCKGAYRGVTDFPGDYVRPGYVDYRFSTWCQIAAARVQLEPLVRAGAARSMVGMGYTEENLNFGFNEPDNPLRMEVQDMIWNREKWRAAKFAWLKPKYAEYGIAAVPANATAEVEKRAEELWKLVERGAPNRSYKQPPWHDAAVEAFVKNKLAAKFPGVQIVKIGLDYKTWVARAGHTLVASDDYFNYYKVTYNSYKRGNVLIKIPGRPFCQLQDFVVGQSGKGMVDAGIGGSGTFMKCE